jgi:hypothetical protein
MDKQFFTAQLAKWKKDQESFQALADGCQNAGNKAFYQRQADRAAAYVADYEQDLAK